MAYKTGTAANHVALFSALTDFLRNDPALVAANQQWAVAWQHATRPNEELVLRGPGLANQDQVFIGFHRTDDTMTLGESAIHLCGMTGIVPTATRFFEHVNALPRRPFCFLDQNPMQYWFVANGRRFVAVIKISNVYQALYGGFFMPYAPPNTYPAPLFVGGTVGMVRNTNDSAQNINSWRAGAVDTYRHFVYPISPWSSLSNYADSQAFMMAPEGRWFAGNTSQSLNAALLDTFRPTPRSFSGYLGPQPCFDVQGNLFTTLNGVRFGYSDIRQRLVAGLNDEMSLTPITLCTYNFSPSPVPVMYGILDGVFSVPGIGNAAENIITVGGVNHLVVPNVMRATVNEYWAFALE